MNFREAQGDQEPHRFRVVLDDDYIAVVWWELERPVEPPNPPVRHLAVTVSGVGSKRHPERPSRPARGKACRWRARELTPMSTLGEFPASCARA